MIDEKLPNHLEVFGRVRNQALFGWVIFLDRFENFERVFRRFFFGIDLPGSFGKDLLFAAQFLLAKFQKLLRR